MGSRERSFTGNTPDAVEYGSELSTYGFRYDACNNLTKLRCSVLGNTWETTYTYDNDNRPSTATLDSGKVITNTYDKLGRLQKKTIGLNTPYETTITYVDVGTNKTSGLIASYRNGNDDPYLYTYDDNGNITSVTHGSIVNTYVYDTANRLIRENNAELNQTITYAYDDWGNNTNESHYAYTTSDNLGTPIVSGNHQYTNSEWGDQQTGFNGEVITYDAMGNPLSYRNGFYNFTWRGRLLTGFTSGNYTFTFEYDEKGLRQKKTVVSPSGTNTTEYYYEGDVLIGMKRNSAKFLFSYDASGNVVSVNYNGTEYYYLRNAQGDIVKLIDASGATVVEYTYRTRGRQISVTGSMASVLGSYQPFRWRGYVLDPEWGIYYLNSRYYDPNSSRFLSPDTYLSTGQGVLGYNAYAYCNDNPVNMVDDGGNRPAKGMNNPDDEDTEDINSTKPNHDLIVFLFGESSELPDGAMYFVEFTSTIGFYVRGTSILFDEEKYCVYTFAGLCASKSYLPIGYVQSEGYVYNMNNIEDYEGFFSSASASLGPFCAGGAKAFNGVYTEILGGAEMVGAGSAGLSGLWYWTTQNDWIYGRYPWEVADHPYNKIFRKDWERVGYA